MRAISDRCLVVLVLSPCRVTMQMAAMTVEAVLY